MLLESERNWTSFRMMAKTRRGHSAFVSIYDNKSSPISQSWKLKELLTALQFIWLNVLGGFVLNKIIHTLYKVYKSVYMFCHVTLIFLVDFVNSNNSIHISIHQQNTYYTVCSKLRLWRLLIEKRRKQVLTIIFIWFWSLINYVQSIKC